MTFHPIHLTKNLITKIKTSGIKRNKKTTKNKRKIKNQIQEHTEAKSETLENSRNFIENIKPKHIEYGINNPNHFKIKKRKKEHSKTKH